MVDGDGNCYYYQDSECKSCEKKCIWNKEYDNNPKPLKDL